MNIVQLKAHIDFLLEGISMIENGEVMTPREFCRDMILASSHVTDFSKKLSRDLEPPVSKNLIRL